MGKVNGGGDWNATPAPPRDPRPITTYMDYKVQPMSTGDASVGPLVLRIETATTIFMFPMDVDSAQALGHALLGPSIHRPSRN